jgi:hypothetical protein
MIGFGNPAHMTENLLRGSFGSVFVPDILQLRVNRVFAGEQRVFLVGSVSAHVLDGNLNLLGENMIIALVFSALSRIYFRHSFLSSSAPSRRILTLLRVNQTPAQSTGRYGGLFGLLSSQQHRSRFGHPFAKRGSGWAFKLDRPHSSLTKRRWGGVMDLENCGRGPCQSKICPSVDECRDSEY